MDTSSKTRLNEDVDLVDDLYSQNEVKKKSSEDGINYPTINGLLNYVVDTFYCCNSRDSSE